MSTWKNLDLRFLRRQALMIAHARRDGHSNLFGQDLQDEQDILYPVNPVNPVQTCQPVLAASKHPLPWR